MTKDANKTRTGFRSRRRAGAPKALGVAVEKITKPLFGKRGLADGAIVRNWPSIVGAAFAKVTAPEKLAFPGGERSGGTLHLRVASGAIATQIQHDEPVILERINGYFGYRAVARLSMKQAPVTAPNQIEFEAPAEISPEDEKEINNSLSSVGDDDLRDALQSLGRSVKARSKGPSTD
ncbi:MAG: DUF721 domain-containing protein [Alphaproteobacteria bacterium]|nr:DUF721 domain-containing protein [Alphaproteobacteria bacterium]